MDNTEQSWEMEFKSPKIWIPLYRAAYKMSWTSTKFRRWLVKTSSQGQRSSFAYSPAIKIQTRFSIRFTTMNTNQTPFSHDTSFWRTNTDWQTDRQTDETHKITATYTLQLAKVIAGESRLFYALSSATAASIDRINKKCKTFRFQFNRYILQRLLVLTNIPVSTKPLTSLNEPTHHRLQVSQRSQLHVT